MADIWVPGFERVFSAKSGGGSYDPGFVYKKIWHKTQGMSKYPRASAKAHANPPHFWVTLPSHPYAPKLKLQIVPLNRSAFALKRPSGQNSPNKQGAIQTEIEGFSENGMTNEDADWLADEVLTPICRLLPIDPMNYWECLPAGAVPMMATTSSPIRRPESVYKKFNGQGAHQHVWGNCVTADTPILCADLVWRPAGDLLPGDDLIGFDEEADGTNIARRFRRSTVVTNHLMRDALIAVHTRHGTVRCNYHHPWLARTSKNQPWGWVEAQNLTPEHAVMRIIDPWVTDRSWESGWLAGMFDGEGSLSRPASGQTILTVSQCESPTADKMLEVLKDRTQGAVYTLRRRMTTSNTPMVEARLQHRAEVMRVLGIVRPERLLSKSAAVWENTGVGRMAEQVQIDHIEPHGTGTIAALETTTRTYIADGFAMHNTHWDIGAAPIGRIGRRTAANLNGTKVPPTQPQEDRLMVTADDEATIRAIIKEEVLVAVIALTGSQVSDLRKDDVRGINDVVEELKLNQLQLAVNVIQKIAKEGVNISDLSQEELADLVVQKVQSEKV